MPLSQSFPTPKTHEAFRVLTKLAVGAPLAAFPVPGEPTPPDPFTPDVSTPVKVTTVIEAIWLLDKVALTETFVSGVDANVRQISDVPLCTLVRSTNAQVSPAPVMLLTVVFVPELGASVATKASSSSLLDFVENVGLTMVVLLVDLSVKTIASVATTPAVDAAEVKLIPVRLTLFTVTFWLSGVKVNPGFVGVTLKLPFLTLLKLYAPAPLAVVVAMVVVPLLRVTVAPLPPAPLIVPEMLTTVLKLIPDTPAPLTVTGRLEGVKVNPGFAGVTV